MRDPELRGPWRTPAQGFRTAFIGWAPATSTGHAPTDVSGGDRAWATWARLVAPWVLAFAVLCVAAASMDDTLRVDDSVRPWLAVAIALPVGLSRRYALVGWRLATIVAMVVAVAGTPVAARDPGTWPVVQQWVWLAMTFLVSLRHDRPTVAWVYAATVATMLIGRGLDDPALAIAASALVLIGDLVRSQRVARQEVVRQAELSELEKARRTVLEERSRIARDLHDVVAHHMSMVVVQAESAPYRLTDLPEQARTEFASISSSAREALIEIRGLLGVLRSDDHTVVTAPAPGFEQIPGLVEGAAGSGVPVRFSCSGTPKAVGAAAGLAAYRIVQEGLANAARHAPGSPVTVHVDHQDAAVEVVVTNAPSDRPAAPGPPGHGLLGMRERAHAVGGRLHAGARPDGGFEVLAVLPADHPVSAR